MNERKPNNIKSQTPTGERQAMRLVKPKPQLKASADKQETCLGKKNSFVRFMNAYADAIDQDIQRIMSL